MADYYIPIASGNRGQHAARRTAKSNAKGSGPCFRPRNSREFDSFCAEKWTRPGLSSSPATCRHGHPRMKWTLFPHRYWLWLGRWAAGVNQHVTGPKKGLSSPLGRVAFRMFRGGLADSRLGLDIQGRIADHLDGPLPGVGGRGVRQFLGEFPHQVEARLPAAPPTAEENRPRRWTSFHRG